MKDIARVILFPAFSVMLGVVSCVAPDSSEKAITAFSIENPAIEGTIDENAKTISLEVPEGTNIRSLTAIFATTGVSVDIGSVAQISGMTVNDFSSPLVYTVTAEDNSTAEYIVTVTVTTKKITTYSFPSINATGSIDESKKTISVAVPGGTDLAALVADFTITGVSVSVGATLQQSGITANDFSSPVIYTVTASDGSTAEYTVSVVQSVSANWTVFDWTDAVSPPDGWQEREAMNSYCTIADGVLSFDSREGGNQAHYRYQFSTPLDTGSAMTLVFKARGDGEPNSLAWMLDFQNTYRGQVEIRNGQVGLQNGGSTIGTAAISASAMHTYMVSYEVLSEGVRINVYIDGAPTAALSGTVTVSTSSIFIRLGDMSNNNAYKGSLDWIMWTADGAFFPGGVDMPEGVSLTP
ncbi:MAG: hypothetical protein JXA18_08370 [Chitinispirillaceae bacterium]|nr:hypothetical protein [Chitinispirillaceae bacterium]